jgi:hypothetical protein
VLFVGSRWATAWVIQAHLPLHQLLLSILLHPPLTNISSLVLTSVAVAACTMHALSANEALFMHAAPAWHVHEVMPQLENFLLIPECRSPVVSQFLLSLPLNPTPADNPPTSPRALYTPILSRKLTTPMQIPVIYHTTRSGATEQAMVTPSSLTSALQSELPSTRTVPDPNPASNHVLPAVG